MTEVKKPTFTEYWTQTSSYHGREKVKDLGVNMSDLTITKHNKVTVASSEKVVGWILRTFKTNERKKSNDDTRQSTSAPQIIMINANITLGGRDCRDRKRVVIIHSLHRFSPASKLLKETKIPHSTIWSTDGRHYLHMCDPSMPVPQSIFTYFPVAMPGLQDCKVNYHQ